MNQPARQSLFAPASSTPSPAPVPPPFVQPIRADLACVGYKAHSAAAPRRRSLALPVVVFVVVTTGGIAALWHLDRKATREAALAARAETSEQKYREARAAFGDDSLDAPAEFTSTDEAAIRSAFASFGKAIHSGHTTLAAAFLDSDRMIRELEALGGMDSIPMLRRSEFTQGIRIGIEKNLGGNLKNIGWTRHQISRIKQLSPDDAVLYARHWDQDNYVSRMRWWVHKHDGAWRIYDWEELLLGSRTTTLLSVMATGFDNGNVAPWTATIKHLPVAIQKSGAGDYDGADKALKLMDGHTYPAEIESIRLFVQGVVQLSREQFSECITSLDRAAALKPDSPAPDYLRAKAYLGKGDFRKALEYADRFQASFGAESDNLMTRGVALYHLNRTTEALAAHRLALDDDPNAAANLAELAAMLPAGKRQELIARFANSAKSREMFQMVIPLLSGPQDKSVASALRNMFRQANPPATAAKQVDPFANPRTSQTARRS